MASSAPESFGSFSTKLDLAVELALAELPRFPGSLSERAGRHQFMKWALFEGVATLAKHFEEGGTLNPFCWRFEIVQEPGVPWHFREYDQRAQALEKSLSAVAENAIQPAEDDEGGSA